MLPAPVPPSFAPASRSSDPFVSIPNDEPTPVSAPEVMPTGGAVPPAPAEFAGDVSVVAGSTVAESRVTGSRVTGARVTGVNGAWVDEVGETVGVSVVNEGVGVVPAPLAPVAVPTGADWSTVPSASTGAPGDGAPSPGAGTPTPGLTTTPPAAAPPPAAMPPSPSGAKGGWVTSRQPAMDSSAAAKSTVGC